MASREAAPVPAEGPPLKAGRRDNVRPLAAGPPLSRRFYARPSPIVARDLLGRLLVRRLPEAVLIGRIVEAEAYQEDDPASHSYRGRTRRTEVMFGPPGHLYVYFTYGMHHCMNVVTGRDGEGSAVLLRAVEPLEGLDLMAERRGVTEPRLLCAGPGRLTQALAIMRDHNGIDLVAGDQLLVTAGRPLPDRRLGVGPRVGVGVGLDRMWRFVDRESAYLSRPVPARRQVGRLP
jgi:DNA-3-methyladenine glycosylase